MADDYQEKITDLRERIAVLEQEQHKWEQACQEIEDELADFTTRYNELVKPIADQIAAVKVVVEQLREAQFQKQIGATFDFEQLWRTRTFNTQPPKRDEPDEAIFEVDTGNKDQKLKHLYRNLARRFHPDLAPDDNERERRTKIMAMINNAYQEADLESLQVLDESAPTDIRQPDAPVNSAVSLSVMVLRTLQTQYEELAVHVRDLKDKHHDLRNGTMMSLKIEDSLARARGDDLLKGLADDMNAEYWEYVQEMDSLRAEIDD